MEIHKIRVSQREGDPTGGDVKHEARRTLGVELDQVRSAKVYRIEGVTGEEAQILANRLFTDPISEFNTVDDSNGTPDTIELRTPNTIEVGYKPGVMNPEAASIIKAAKDLGITAVAADSSIEFGFYGEVEPDQIGQIAARFLVNPTVQQVVTKEPETLRFEGRVGRVETVAIRDASDEQLKALSKDKLFLNLEEMHVIQDYFKQLDRDPTDGELETIAGKWSEHCGHKTFEAKVVVDGVEKEPLITRIKNAAKRNFKGLVVSAFKDNAGVIKFFDGWTIAGKVETHNSPSAIEPYGGAATGTGGVLRDIFGVGKGAKVIISQDMFCFAEPDMDPAKLPVGTLNPDYLQRRVVQGVRDYGNRMGIPTANGSVHYHEDFRAKPTVIVGAYGIMPEKYAEKGQAKPGDLVVVIGGRTGRDGIHGGTFASGEMTDRTINVNSSAVQIGNAIEEKRTADAALEARDLDLIVAATDCGALGLESAISEMGEKTGVMVDLKNAPLKYAGLDPWEIWISESQERMVYAVSPDNIERFRTIMDKYNVEMTVLGEFTDTHKLVVNYGDQNLVDLDYNFLENGLPQRRMEAHFEKPIIDEIRPEAPVTEQDWIDTLKSVLSHGNVCSKEAIVRQYDHGVQGGNVVPPYGGKKQNGPNDALVIRPVLDKPYGIVQSHGLNPILNRLDPFEGSVWAFAEAASNYVAVGGDIRDAAAVGNYIWPFPDEQEMGSLDLSVDAAVYSMDALGVPVISGKDSLSSTYRGQDGEVIKIPPVYEVSLFGRIPDVEKTVTSDIKKPNSLLVLVGAVDGGMGGSTYYDVANGSSGKVPKVDMKTLPVVLDRMHEAISTGRVLSCHDVSEGGVITTVTEMCIGGDCGAIISSDCSTRRADDFLFNETAGRFVVEVEDPGTAGDLFHGLPYQVLGMTTNTKQLSVMIESERFAGERKLFAANVDELNEAYQGTMKGVF